MVTPIESSSKKTWVWDASVRLAHWLLAICFATAYATGDSESWRLWHIYSGSGVLAIVCFRVLWGFIGTPHARFSDFVHSPSKALRYLRTLVAGEPEHHLGHNPAGGLAVIGLLCLSAITSIIGWVIYQGTPPHWLEEAHEIAANLTLTLVVIHVVAVVVSSKLHHENLIKAMVMGYKPAHPSKPETASLPAGKIVLGITLLFVFIFFAWYCVVIWS
jgi:cytochrome b